MVKTETHSINNIIYSPVSFFVSEQVFCSKVLSPRFSNKFIWNEGFPVLNSCLVLEFVVFEGKTLITSTTGSEHVSSMLSEVTTIFYLESPSLICIFLFQQLFFSHISGFHVAKDLKKKLSLLPSAVFLL